MKISKGEKIFNILNIFLLTILSFIAIYPFIYVLAASFSDPAAVLGGKVWFISKGFELGAYKEIINYPGLWMAYGNTVFYAGVGTIISMVITICGAYPLSKTRLRGKTFLTFMMAFTMWFSAGLIPAYLNFRDLNLLDSRLALLFGFCCSAFYVIIMRTYFSGIPASLEESAKLDGASDIAILTKIYLPLSAPCLATLSLYYLVDRWNAYFWAMILLKDETKIPLQVILNTLIVKAKWSQETASIDATQFNRETLIYATIVVSILPVIIVYPILQKYFVKGIMLGSVKG